MDESATPSYYRALPHSVQAAMIIAMAAARPPAAGPSPSTSPPPPTILPPPTLLVLPSPSPSPSSPSPTSQQQQRQQLLLITPPPAAPAAQPSAGPPIEHIFAGTKALNVACGVCNATTTGGGCWRRLWALQMPRGEWLNGCNRDGLRLRHNKIKPPLTGPYAAVAGWRTITPPRRVHGGDGGAGAKAAAAAAAAAAAGEEEHSAEVEEEDDQCEDEAAVAAWTLVGMGA